MKAIRVFFAISLTKSTQDLVKQVLEPLQLTIPAESVCWIPLQGLHVTLQFLPKIKYAHLKNLIEWVHIELKTCKPFKLELGGVELFPTTDHPRVIALHAGPHHVLAGLAHAIGLGIAAADYPVQTGLFRGHLTLGRLANTYQPFSLEGIKLPPIPKIEIRDLCLFESKQDKDRALYIPLEYFSLCY